MKRIFFILLILLQLNGFSQMVVGYLPYYRGIIENYDYAKYTHLHYFTIWPGANGEFNYPGEKDSVFMANQFKSIAQMAKPHGVKMIMTFGGPSDHASLHFVEMAANDSIRTIFVQNVLNLCKQWKADGIDIDWEWAQHTDTKTSNYAFTSLMEDLRIMCDENNLSLSLDVAASSWNGKYYNPEAVNLADYINVMTYAYNGSWSNGAGHHSSMKDIKNAGMPYWENKGIPKSKLNIGTAFFGQVYEGTSTLGGSFSKVDAVLYPQVKQLIKSGYLVVEDNENGTYCYSASNNEIVFYDSPQNTASKMEYAINNGYAGIIIWEIGQDDAEQSLATAIDNVRKVSSSATEISKNIFPFKIFQNEGRIEIKDLRGNEIIDIYNLNGAKMNQKITANEQVYKSTKMSPGIYLVVIYQNGKMYQQKIAIPF